MITDRRTSRTVPRVLAAHALTIVCAVIAGARGQSPNYDYAALREKMVAEEIEAAGVTNPRVLAAMRATPRHEFVPAGFRRYAYVDAALPIGSEQTISPPYVVAYMTAALDPQPSDRVLEIGAGSGYQAAVLCPLAAEVYTIEIVEQLGRRAGQTLARLGYNNVHVRVGDGYQGWPEQAPFDKIIVTCSPENVPQPLVDQLRDGGQMIIPVGERYQQNLFRLTKRKGRLDREALQATLFVPMTGAAESQRVVKPNPLRPVIRNGSFEQAVGDTDQPAAWHYLRGARLATAPDAPDGSQVLVFKCEEPGRASRALQGFAIDGRKVSRLEASGMVRGYALAEGPTADAAAALMITFYDDRRAAIANEMLGPWTGDFPWRRESRTVLVPLAAREAIIRMGLHGGTGRLEVDDVEIAGVAAPSQ